MSATIITGVDGSREIRPVGDRAPDGRTDALGITGLMF